MAADPITYTDYEVSQEHAKLLEENLPPMFRTPIQVRKYIEGVRGRRIGEGLKEGIWVKPIGSVSGTTFSSVQDVAHRSLVIVAQRSTTGDMPNAPRYDRFRQTIRKLFQNRRSTRLKCELYTTVSEGSYEIDEALMRKLDVDIFEISTRFREDR